MRLKSMLANTISNYPALFRVASRTYHKLNPSFRPLSSMSQGSPYALSQAFQKAKDLNPLEMGDYYEFGLYRGYTFWYAQNVCGQLGISDTHFYGFDSFQGLPPIKGIDRLHGQFFKGQFACSKAEVINNLTKRGIDWSRATLIDGFFDKTLTEDINKQYDCKEVAVALIDCDLYSSTRDVLTWLASLLTDNSILLFDDWYAYGKIPELGQQRAFQEFLNTNKQFSAEPFIEFQYHGASFILHMT